MIEWVFCHVESMKKLHSIITTISNEISSKKPKGSSTRSITLIVGLSSGTGSCLSSCFVEKLYDYFDTFPPSDGFRVKRNHLHNDTPPSAVQWEQLPYQHSLNYHRHVKDSIKIKSLTTSKDWSPLPLILNDSLEVAYREYPLSTNVVIDDNNVDFVSGTFYNKKTGQKSFIRCTVQPEHLIVEVRDLVHETYKPFVKSYEAAGILPYSVHPVTGEAIFLIGKLTYDGGTWCDFGGLVSNFRFRETPSVTAARECYEETLGVIGSSDHLLKSLRNYKVNNAFKVINERTRYIGHYLRIPFDHYPSRFVSRVMEILSHDKSVEVDTMRWLPMSSVRRATVLSLTGSSSIDVYAIKETVSVSLPLSLSLYITIIRMVHLIKIQLLAFALSLHILYA
jgi:8-oxo-dGTP pyrophosphatase MutT (NUDIX family)